MRNKTLASVTATLSLGVLLTACGSSGVTVNSPAATSTSSSASTSSSSSSTSMMTSESPSSSETPMTSDTPSSSAESSSSSASTPAPSLTSPDAIHKSAFLKIVKEKYPELSDAQALADGTFVCQQMSQDKGLLNIIGSLQDKHSKWTTQQAGFFLGLSVGALCSQYTSKIGAN